jgi:hypothetical protein
MPLIQVRDVPDWIYESLAEKAKKERRSLAQQTVAVLAQGLQVELDAKARRQGVLAAVRAGAPAQKRKLRAPAKLIGEDRRR